MRVPLSEATERPMFTLMCLEKGELETNRAIADATDFHHDVYGTVRRHARRKLDALIQIFDGLKTPDPDRLASLSVEAELNDRESGRRIRAADERCIDQ